MAITWRRYLLWFCGSLAALHAVGGINAWVAQAQDLPALPDLANITTPGTGTYDGYLDFAKHYKWHYLSVPQPIVQAAAECMAGIVYELATPQERAILDSASQGAGISIQAEQDFVRSFKGRLSDDEIGDRADRDCERENEAMARALSK
jgi:hypothetical protein